MFVKRITVGLLAVLCVAAGLTRPLLASWGDLPAPPQEAQPAQPSAPPQGDPQKPAIEDQESWKKYSFALPYADGTGNLRFVDLARSGRPFVLVWWLSDCPVCNMEMPYVQQLARMGDDKKVDVWVVGINMDDTDNTCNRFIKDKKIVFNIVRDPHGRKTDDKYGVRNEGTPMTYIFKPGGEYVGKLSGYTKNFPARVLDMLDIPVPDAPPGTGTDVQRSDGTHEHRQF
jgi:thiol-disulfide isomerase/thioredoxin